jgi:CBS domain-containing protein
MKITLLHVLRDVTIYCKKTSNLFSIADILQSRNIGSILVKDSSDGVVGIITVGDLLRAFVKHDDLSTLTAQDIMSAPVITASSDLELDDGLRILKENNIGRLVITNKDGKVIGIIKDSVLERMKAVTIHPVFTKNFR